LAIDAYLVLYGRTTGLRATAFLDRDEYMTLSKASVSDSLTSLFTGRQSRLALLSESGLYRLIMRSDKPEARAFQDWVTRVVLPAIRKDTGYVMGEEKVVTGEIDEDVFILKAMEMLQGKVAADTIERDLGRTRSKPKNPSLAKHYMRIAARSPLLEIICLAGQHSTTFGGHGCNPTPLYRSRRRRRSIYTLPARCRTN